MFAKLHLALLALAATAAAQIPGQKYYIRNFQSGRVLDVRGGSKLPGADVIIYSKNVPQSPNQLWTVDDEGYITSVNSGLVLTAPFNAQGRLEAGAFLQQNNKTGEANQLWFHDRQDRLVNRYNQNLVIWGQGGNVQTIGTRAVVDYKVNVTSQTWNFENA